MELPEDVKNPPTYTKYYGSEKNPLPIGHKQGLLTVIGYSHDTKKPYVLKCKCGNVLIASRNQLIKSKEIILHCGCFDQITRAAYLIRLRVEALRSWWAQMNYWLDDLHTLREWAKRYRIKIKPYTRGGKSLYPEVVRLEHAENPLLIDHGINEVPEGDVEEVDAFLKLLAPNPEYEQFLRTTADALTKNYEPWPAIPMASASAYYSYKNELPEFDAATFINFVNYLIDMEKNLGKTSGNNPEIK